MKNKSIFNVLVIMFVVCVNIVLAQNKPRLQMRTTTTNGRKMTILVTAYPHNEKQRSIVEKLQNNDFEVLENKRAQKIISVKNAGEAPINLAIVVQENLDWRVNSEIKGLREFIKSLPQGSRAMTAYLTIGGAIVTQDLTTNLTQAAETLRIIRGGSLSPTFSPYYGVQDVVKHFDEKPTGRQMMLVISDGLDLSGGFNYASPYFSLSLDKAINDANRRGVSIFTIYAPSDDRKSYGRFAVNYGQGSLIRLADETGGESYIPGIDFINFSPYLKEFPEIFPRQWLITYRSSTVEKGFRKIEVTTDFDIHLHHPAGYEPKK